MQGLETLSVSQNVLPVHIRAEVKFSGHLKRHRAKMLHFKSLSFCLYDEDQDFDIMPATLLHYDNNGLLFTPPHFKVYKCCCAFS